MTKVHICHGLCAAVYLASSIGADKVAVSLAMAAIYAAQALEDGVAPWPPASGGETDAQICHLRLAQKAGLLAA